MKPPTLELIEYINAKTNKSVYGLDTNYNYLFFNQTHVRDMQERFGVSVSIGDNNIALIASEQVDVFKQLYDKGLSGKAFTDTQQFDEDYFDFEFFPISSNDSVTGVIVEATNVSARVAVEHELRDHKHNLELQIEKGSEIILEQKNFFQSIINEDPSAIMIRDAEGRHVLANKSAAELFELDLDNVLGARLDDFLEEGKDLQKFIREDQDVLTNGVLVEGESKLDHKGHLHWLSGKKKLIETNGKKYVLGVYSDITYLKKIQEEQELAYAKLEKALDDLKEMQLRLVSSEKMASIGMITSGLVHEINNPINFVAGNVAPLKLDFEELLDGLKEKFGDDLPEDLKETIAEIPVLLEGVEDGALRVKKLTKRLKLFGDSNTESEKLVNINEAIRSITRIMSPQIMGRVEIIEDFAKVEEILAAPGTLNQLIMNLLENAIQSISGTGQVTIRTRKEGSNKIIEVEDSGSGIDEEFAEKVYDPFFTTKGDKHSGLGLAICRRIVSKIEGVMHFKQSNSGGTIFTIQIPNQRV
ncbi:MAG: PAS domain S-box protein [Cyclobacteriaceae bacterium]